MKKNLVIGDNIVHIKDIDSYMQYTAKYVQYTLPLTKCWLHIRAFLSLAAVHLAQSFRLMAFIQARRHGPFTVKKIKST